MITTIGLDEFGTILAALGALATAAFGLLDSTKALWGGVSNLGVGHLDRALKPFGSALASAVGADRWRDMVLANWRNGMAKEDQKMAIRALIKLGLTTQTAPDLARAAHLDPKALTAVAAKLARGAELTDADLNLLGRLSAVADAILDSAFERAEHQYRNVSRMLAGLIAVALAYGAWFMWPVGEGKPHWGYPLIVGVLAVPLAPVAKDLTSALSTAMRALKASRPV
ncbi:MAG: hypothetical protein ACOY5Y_02495 [Pseudomonadota bacterium]|jgi:hypothetical protein